MFTNLHRTEPEVQTEISIMKRLKTILLTILCLSTFTDSFAQGEDDGLLYVYIKTSADAALYELSDLNKITFSDKGVQLWNTAWPTEYPYKSVSVISFKKRKQGGTTGISTKTEGEGKINIGYNALQSVVTVVSDVLLDRVAVYDLQGRCIVSDNDGKQVYNLSLSSSPQGVYIVKAYGKKAETTKRIVKQ